MFWSQSSDSSSNLLNNHAVQLQMGLLILAQRSSVCCSLNSVRSVGSITDSARSDDAVVVCRIVSDTKSHFENYFGGLNAESHLYVKQTSLTWFGSQLQKSHFMFCQIFQCDFSSNQVMLKNGSSWHFQTKPVSVRLSNLNVNCL